MIDVLLKIPGFVAIYALCAIAAWGLHLFAGVLSVGVDEVRRQVRKSIDVLGYRYPIWILTAGIYPSIDLEEGTTASGGDPAE